MHHFLYPSQDTYIDNSSTYANKNIGIDEILSIGVSHSYAKTLNTQKTYSYHNEFVAAMALENYTGILTGSFYGTAPNVFGNITGTTTNFSTSYFSGSLTGNVNGLETGSTLVNPAFTGNLIAFSGSIISTVIDGRVTGSIKTGCCPPYTGQLTSSVGRVTGYLTGDEIKAEQYYSVIDQRYINRSLIQFNLSTISQSIVAGNITSPTYYLKLTSTEARELPITYKVHAFPISQSWTQGDGYFSDEGSDNGASWYWKDYNSGSAWHLPITTSLATETYDYIDTWGWITESFSRGGGTWYNIHCSQSFDYQVSDVNMDVTTIVNSWLNNTVANNGFILLYSGETALTASNAVIKFFSKDTNTIYSPKLDVAWDDSTWATGSFTTSSIDITSLSSRITGSIKTGVTISNVYVSGSVYGNAYFTFDANDNINTGSIVNLTGNSQTVNALNINGLVLGTFVTNSLDNTIRYVTASLSNGDFANSTVYGQYSSSMLTGYITGSFNEQLFLNHRVSGNYLDNNNQIIQISQYSPVSGSLIGSASGLFNNATITGIAIDGNLKGANLTIPITGSYCFLTASYAYTSSINITSSALSPLDVSKPFVTVVQNLKKDYSFGDVVKINVFAREMYPPKTFDRTLQQSTYMVPKYLPSSSYYSIKDNETEEVIINFDAYTKLSCDSLGNYFYLDTTGLAQERYYKILINVVGNGNIYTFDNNNVFKIKR